MPKQYYGAMLWRVHGFPAKGRYECGFSCLACEKKHGSFQLTYGFGVSKEERRKNMEAHLSSVHGIATCEHCGEQVKRRGLRKHQSTDACLAIQLRASLEREGFAELRGWEASKISEYFCGQAFRLLVGTKYVPHDWESGKPEDVSWETYAAITNAATAAKARFMDAIGFRFTDVGYWIRKEYLDFVRLREGRAGTERHPADFIMSEDLVRAVLEYHDNPDLRESILAILELKQEAPT